MRKVLNSIVFLLLVSAVLLLSGCGVETKAKRISEEGINEFTANDFNTYLHHLRNSSGLSDLEASPHISYYAEYDYDEKSKTLYATCKFDFNSDEIDDYFTTEYNGDNALKLAKVLSNLKRAYFSEKKYEYSTKSGAIVLNVTGRVLDNKGSLSVVTSSGREYHYSDYGSYAEVSIDGNVVYLEKLGGSSINSKNDNNSITEYDATLSFGSSLVPVFFSEDVMDRYTYALVNDDQGTLNELLLSSQMAYIDNGSKCNIVKSGITKTQVKILEGTYSGETVWVASEYVNR